MAKKRMMWLDLAKGLAILLMVLGHCLADDCLLHGFIYSFHMPLFFLAAGFTMRAKPRNQVIKSSARRLLVPYFIVCGILFAFAFVSPNTLNANLDTQRSWPVVLVEILYAAGDSGVIWGHMFQAIGALWFLPCLFVARILLNEVLLRSEALGHQLEAPDALAKRTAAAPDALQRLAACTPARWVARHAQVLGECAGVAALVVMGIAIGNQARLPFDVDTALVVTFFMYLGILAKRSDLMHAPLPAWIALTAVWFCYTVYGSGDIAVRSYLDNPVTLVTAAAGSLVVMKLCMGLERFGIPAVNRGLAWCGVASLYILCVHRVESAVFNWQKIMEFFRPDVWNWDQTLQGLYWFGLRLVLVLACTYVLDRLIKAGSRAWHRRRDAHAASVPSGLPARRKAHPVRTRASA
ncbi:MAG: acyltransferase family protein [Eggerthellaceae bacterium]|jgi:fucose 4-O-acetylase-like acetyltransferase